MDSLPLTVEFFEEKGKIRKTNLLLNGNKLTWKIHGNSKNGELENRVGEWMEAYMEGKRPRKPLPICFEGSSHYSQTIFNLLATIPFGKSLTYKELASLAGKPQGARAAGNACGRNPLPLIIPCHRIVASNGGLGGFAFGLVIKEMLLKHEGKRSIMKEDILNLQQIGLLGSSPDLICCL